MTTPRTRALVSFAAAMALTLVLGACARTPSRPAVENPAPVELPPLTIRFDNNEREYVRVYLINAQREWPLGRVEPGATASLRIPEASLAGSFRFFQLAVIVGGPMTLRASRDPRATFTIAQPAPSLLSHRWRFAEGQLTPLRMPDRGADARRP